MEYNSQRSKLVIPEYGRNIQKMVEYACTIEDKQERNNIAMTIIQVMGQLHPHLRDVQDFKHKLWHHLFIISDYKLDVDSPYDVPSPEQTKQKPTKVEYPGGKIRYKHYGKTTERLIEAAKQMTDGEEKEALVCVIANLMKKSYLNWNRDSVNDQVIFDHLDELSGGELKTKEGFELNQTHEILTQSKRKKRTGKNHKDSGGRFRRRRQ